MNFDALTRSASRLGETVRNQDLWPDLLRDIAESTGALGAALLQAGAPTVGVPWSPSLGRMKEVYYREGWNTRDLRAIRSVSAVRRGLVVLTDEDLVSREEVERDPYYTSFLSSQRLSGCAAIAFRSSPSDVCGLVIQRTASQGVFDEREKHALACLAPRLTATAELTQMLAETSLRTSLAVLDRLPRPAVVLGQDGAVLDANIAAATLFDDDFRERAGRLFVRDERAAAEIQKAWEQAQMPFGTPMQQRKPIIVRRKGRLPLILRPLPLDGPAGNFFLGASLLVTFTDPEMNHLPPPELLRSVFGMTRAEARLANHLAAGLSLHQAADFSSITIETARSHLKCIFAKTGSCRQAELVVLLGRL